MEVTKEKFLAVIKNQQGNIAMLKRSHKNLRWEEASFIYCHRNNIEWDFDSFTDELMKEDSKYSMKEFEEICKEVREFDMFLRRRNPKTPLNLDTEGELLLYNFGVFS